MNPWNRTLVCAPIFRFGRVSAYSDLRDELEKCLMFFVEARQSGVLRAGTVNEHRPGIVSEALQVLFYRQDQTS